MGKSNNSLSKLVFKLVSMLFLLSCNSELLVNPEGSGSSTAYISGFDRLSAKPGEEVMVTGKNLSTKVVSQALHQHVRLIARVMAKRAAWL